MLVSKAALRGGAILAAALVSACSAGNKSTTTGGTGGGTGGTGGSTTTTTTSSSTTSGSLAVDPPEVVDNGGMVIKAPKVQLIVYAEDPDAADAQAFLEEFASTPTWAAQASEYGVGPLTVLSPIMIAGTPPATLEDNLNGNITPFEQTLVTNITGSRPALGRRRPEHDLHVPAPQGTNVKSDGSCCSYLGYHFETTAGSINVPYAVSCNCGLIQGAPLTALQWVTTTLSHEVVEAATDPFPASSLAWSGTDADHLAWTNATGGEVADMCEYNQDSNYIPPGAKYMVQRSWSRQGGEGRPRTPASPSPPRGPYFNAAPVLTDSVEMATQFGTTSATKGVKIPIGQTKTIDIDLEADGALSGPATVTVTVLDFNYFSTGGNPFMDVSFGGSPDLGQGHDDGLGRRRAAPDDQVAPGRPARRLGPLHRDRRSRHGLGPAGEHVLRRRRPVIRR